MRFIKKCIAWIFRVDQTIKKVDNTIEFVPAEEVEEEAAATVAVAEEEPASEN